MTLGPFDIPIVREWKAIGAQEEAVGQVLLGFSHLDSLTFLVRPEQHPTVERDTIVHEMVHLLLDSASLHDIIPHDNEEAFVRRLSPILLMILRDNPELVAYLLAKD